MSSLLLAKSGSIVLIYILAIIWKLILWDSKKFYINLFHVKNRTKIVREAQRSPEKERVFPKQCSQEDNWGWFSQNHS